MYNLPLLASKNSPYPPYPLVLRLKLAKGCIPTKWKMKGSVVVQGWMSVGIDDIRGFVEAQFYFLSTDFCSKVFNLRYPPITVFMGENARHRFRKHVMKEESFEKRIKTNDDLLLFINSYIEPLNKADICISFSNS